MSQVPQVGDWSASTRSATNVVFLIRRGGAEQTVQLKTAATPGEATRPMVGISIGVDSPVKVSVNLGQDIGGPSAGTAFALAIYDKLTPGPLLDGKHVAGTGTIDALGQVGAIGGIQQKIAGAKNDGATVFLVPAPNCDAALHADVKDIRLVKITTLNEAIAALQAVTAVGRCPAMRN